MKLTYIRFDRVFDIQRRANRAGNWTEFGFEADGKKVYGVSVVGYPAIPVGQPLLAVVEDDLRWKQIYGWRNLNTGELAALHRKSTLIGLCIIGVAFLLATVPLWLLNYPLAIPSTRVITGAILLTGALYLAREVVYQWRRLAAHRMLRSGTAAGVTRPGFFGGPSG